MAEVLVLANETIGGKNLLDAVRERAAEGDARFHVVVPLTRPKHGNVIYDEAVRDSAQVRVDLALAFMREEGIAGRGEVGDGDPLNAAHDVIADRGISEIIVSTLPESTSGWMRRDLIEALESDTGLPVKHVVVDLEEEGLPFDVTLVVANQTVAGGELVERLKALADDGPAPVHHRGPAGQRRRPRGALRARAPLRAAGVARGGGDRRRGHDRRPRPLHGDHERRPVLPHLRDRHLDAARGLVEVDGGQAHGARRQGDREAGRARRVVARSRWRPDGGRRRHRRARRPRAPRPAAGQPVVARRPVAARDGPFHHLRGDGLRGLLHGLLLHPGRAGRRVAGRGRAPAEGHRGRQHGDPDLVVVHAALGRALAQAGQPPRPARRASSRRSCSAARSSSSRSTSTSTSGSRRRTTRRGRSSTASRACTARTSSSA